MRLTWKIYVAILVLLAGTTSFASGQNAEKLLIEAEKHFNEAIEISQNEPLRSKELFTKAALRFEKISKNEGIKNGKLFYNTGNAYFLAGDVGRAILNYKQAARFLESDRDLKQNLKYARSVRLDKIDSISSNKPFKLPLFWHYDLTLSVRAFVFIVFYISGWIFACCWLFKRTRKLKWAALICLACSIGIGTSVALDYYHKQNTVEGVIIADEVIARKGGSPVYKASFSAPLHSGTELKLIGQRNSWYYIQLTDGKKTWIPLHSAKVIQ